ncbi:MAG: hypothetical protein AAF665_06265 [Pseudomonadota bacterium]
MKNKNRFIQSIIATSEKTDAQMPWARGKRRQEFILKRSKQAKTERRSA